MIYHLVICYIAIENGHLQLIYRLKMVIVHSYLSLPEGIMVYFVLTYLKLVSIDDQSYV